MLPDQPATFTTNARTINAEMQPEVTLFAPGGIGEVEVAGEPFVVVRRVCRALQIEPNAEIARLQVLNWSGLRVERVANHRGQRKRLTVMPRGAAKLWLVSLDIHQVARRHRRWLEDLQQQTVDLLANLFD